MITTQSFFSFLHDDALPVTPLYDLTLSDHFPIHFSITWHFAPYRTCKTQFFLNTSLLSHPPTATHIRCTWNLAPRPHSHTGWIQWWNDDITRTMKFLCIYGCQLAIYHRRYYEATIKDLFMMSKSLVQNLFDTRLQTRVANLCH